MAVVAESGFVTRKLGSLQRLALCSLGGLMIAHAFPRVGCSGLAPFALIPILLGTAGVSVTRAWFLGWASGIVTYAIAWAWTLDAVQVFQSVSVGEAILPATLGQLYHAGQFAVFAAAVNWLRDGRVRVPIVATAAAWGLLEWGYPKFAWWSIGNVTIDWPYLPQIADTVGVSGVSFLVTATGAALFNALFAGSLTRYRRWTPVFVLIACYVGAIAYGWSRGSHFSERRTSESLEVGVVQASMPVGDRDPRRASAERWRAYASASAVPELRGVDVVVWPETTVRDYLRHGSPYAMEAANLAAALDTNLILGALDLPHQRPGEYSAAYAYSPDGDTQWAHKMRLLPFGEYVPGQEWIPWLSSWRTTGKFLPGVDHPVLQVAGMSLASSICIEAVRPGFNNEEVRQGAHLLVNLSDDTWFGHSNLPYMHFQAVRWRAIEARRWIVRASNSGISAVIDPAGGVVASVSFGNAGWLRQRVFAETVLTRFVRWGPWFVWFELLVLVLAGVVRLLYRAPTNELS